MFLLFLSQSAQAYLDFHLSNFQIFENFRHLAFFQHLYLNIFACIPFPRPSLPFLTSISTNKGASKYQDSFFAPLILMYTSIRVFMLLGTCPFIRQLFLDGFKEFKES